MSRRRKILLSIIAIIFLLYILTQWDEIVIKTKLRINCFDEYSADFSLDNIYVKENDSIISVYFLIDTDITESNKQIIFDIYSEIYNIVFIDLNKFENYSVNLVFKYSKNDTVFGFYDINKNRTGIEIFCEEDSIEINDIATHCPGANRLKLGKMNYTAIEDFSCFQNLELVWCIYEIIDIDEKKYILSLFPDCEIISDSY